MNLFSKPIFWGPNIYVPFILCGLFIGASVIPVTLHNEGHWISIGLLACVLIAYLAGNNFCFLGMVFILHLLVGATANEIDAKAFSGYLRVDEIKSQKGNYLTIWAEEYRFKKNNLARANRRLICKLNNKKSKIKIGDIIYTTQVPIRISQDKNPGTFNIINYYRSKGIHYQCFIDTLFVHVAHEKLWYDYILACKEKIENQFKKYLEGQALAIANALLLGNSQGIDTENKQAFSNTGTIHVLAVSGMHVSLFAEMLMLCFGIFPSCFSKRSAGMIVISVLWIYACLTGLSSSVIRAVLMFSMLQLSSILGRRAQGNLILFWCAILMFLFNPACIYDIGFQLSFLAVYGISNYKDKIIAIWSPKNKAIKFLWGISCIAIAAQLLTTPLMLYHFHCFPNYFLIANVFIVVLSAILMYFGFAFLLLAWVPWLNQILAFIFSLLIKLLLYLVHLIAALPGAVVYGFDLPIWIVVILYGFILIFFHCKINYFMRSVMLTTVVCFLSFNRFNNQNETHLCILQGKSNFVAFKTQSNLTIYCREGHKVEDIRRVIQSYQKIYPTKTVKILPLNTNQWAKSSYAIISNQGYTWKIETKGQNYVTPMYQNMPFNNPKKGPHDLIPGDKIILKDSWF